jgi:threonine dehydratase
MPTTAPLGKLDAAQAYGSEVRLVGTTFVERRDAAETFAAEHDLALVPPFDDPHIIAGQGTCGLEITEDLEDIDVVIAPIGGGGLVAGLCLCDHRSSAVSQHRRRRGPRRRHHGPSLDHR